MRKRIRRKGHLIQKSRPREIDLKDFSSRHASEGKFRITAINQNAAKAWVVGEYATFREAKEQVDKSSEPDVVYYVHGSSSRVLYSGKGSG